jgi:hypothetical protein
VDEEYHALVSVVAPAFPYLKKLYISIRNDSFLHDPGDEIIESYQQKLLGPIDEMVRKLGPQLQDCQVALPFSLYKALEYRAKSDGARIECGGCGYLHWRRIWRPLPVEQDEHSENDLGYWIRRGKEYTPFWKPCCFSLGEMP